MEILDVKYRKVLLNGAREVLYDCPKCGSSLTTAVQDIPKGDTCPDCSVSFKFSTRAKLLVKEHVLREKKDAEDRLAKKEAKKKIKEQNALARAKEKEADARLLKEKQDVEVAIRRLEKSQVSYAKRGAIACFIVGAIVVVSAFNFDTSVSTGTSLGRVNNIGLMNQQRNMMLFGIGLLVIGGVLLAVHLNKDKSNGIKFDRRIDKLCPKCGEPVRKIATLCKHCNSEI